MTHWYREPKRVNLMERPDVNPLQNEYFNASCGALLGFSLDGSPTGILQRGGCAPNENRNYALASEISWIRPISAIRCCKIAKALEDSVSSALFSHSFSDRLRTNNRTDQAPTDCVNCPQHH
jgi:hypothetical protein